MDSDVRNELLVDVEDEGKVGEMAALALKTSHELLSVFMYVCMYVRKSNIK